MPIIQLTPLDRLTQRFRIALERIAKIDSCDLTDDFPELRLEAHAELRKLIEDAARAGYTEAELYDCVVGEEESRADFEVEGETEIP
jgi:hypothetical protein